MADGPSDNIFRYVNLREFLKELSRLFPIFPMNFWRGQPGIILRHDCDLDIEPAYRLSQIIMETEARSTFFIMTTAETYNPASPKNRKMLYRMSEEGFEIALHFDPAMYAEASDVELARLARTEAAILEQITGKSVTSVSLHNPSIHNRYVLLDGWMNAYDPRIFSPDVYLSDSRMHFHTDPRQFLQKVAMVRTAQLLLHPMHYSESGSNYPAPMLAYCTRVAQSLDKMFKGNHAYRDLVGDSFLHTLSLELKRTGLETAQECK